jgi:hypothetical protein
MHVHDAVVFEFVKQVLSGGTDVLQVLTVNPTGISAKSSLGTGNPQRLADQQLAMLIGQEVCFVAFGHVEVLSWKEAEHLGRMNKAPSGKRRGLCRRIV